MAGDSNTPTVSAPAAPLDPISPVLSRVWDAVKEGIPAFNQKFQTSGTQEAYAEGEQRAKDMATPAAQRATPEHVPAPKAPPAPDLNNPQTAPPTEASGVNPQRQTPQAPAMQLVHPEAAMTPKERAAHPILTGVAETAGGLTSPENTAIIAGTGGFGELPGTAGAIVPKLISLGFSAQSLKGAYDQIPQFKAAMDKGDESEAQRVLTHIVLDTAMGVAAGAHGTEGIKSAVERGGEPDAASTLSAPKAEENLVPRIDFNAIGGKELRGPTTFGRTGGKFGQAVDSAFQVARDNAVEPDISSEGPEWDRTHSASVNGQKVGSVGYKLDPSGRAQIYGSQVNPELRGKGIGQKLYQRAIDDARSAGATRITSDSTNTSPDANRVWEKLRDKGAPVENITHPNGKPGYQIDFENPPEKETAAEPPEAQFEPAMARRGELPNQRVNFAPAYGDTGRYVGGLIEHRIAGDTPEEKIQNYTNQLGPYKGSGLLPVPEHLHGYEGSTEATVGHELGHAIVGHIMGLPLEGAEIRSHMHPENASTGSAASMHFDWGKIPGAEFNHAFGRHALNAKALGDVFPKLLPTMMAGGAAEELGFGQPSNENWGTMGDRQEIARMGNILGFTPEETKDMMQAGHEQAKQILSHPDTLAILKEEAAQREPNLPKTLHVSADRLGSILSRVKEARNGIDDSENGPAGGGVVSENEPGATGSNAEGNVREDDRQAVPAIEKTAVASKYHPDLQQILDKPYTQVSADASPLRESGSAAFITPDGKFAHLSPGVTHDYAIDDVRGGSLNPGESDNRVGFLNDTGSIRVRTSKDRAGNTVHVSVPARGVTDEQIPAIRQAIAQAGRTGNVVMERADVSAENKDTATMSKEFPRAGDTEDYLRQISAHPDQAREAAAKATRVTNQRNMPVSEAANEFNKLQGRPALDTTPKPVSEAFAKRLADHFDTLEHEPDNPEVKKSYDALKSDINKQWDYATKKMGVTFEPWSQEGQPYKNSREMMADVKDNHHLYFFQGGDIPSDHPMGEVDAKTGLKYMDKLRAIHDLFGHAAEGHQFGPTGEENAYLLHRQMFSPEAIPALTNETRAQNAWVNFGKHMRNASNEVIGKGEPGYVAPPDRPYAEQKATMLAPEFNAATPGKAPADITQSVQDVASTFQSTPFTANDVKLFTNSNEPAAINAAIDQLVDEGKLRAVDATHYRAVPQNGWSKTAAEMAAQQPAGGLDPRTGQPDTKGIGTEMLPEARQALDHAPTQADFEAFQAKNQDLLDKYPELRIGWDNTSNLPGGHEINLGAIGDGAARVAKKLDQRAAFDIEKQQEIPTAGVGLRSEFPNYPIEDRMNDLRNQPLSDVKNFEHLSKPVYDNLEPDEREYLKGNKTLQRNVMTQYHKIAPSVNETTNAMQAGAALGGWWQRYMDIFHGLGEGGTQTPSGKLLYHYTTKPFHTFDPLIGGPHGDFGVHLGTLAQAHGRMQGAGESLENTEKMVGEDIGGHIRPVYADIKNPLRLEDYGEFRPDMIAAQLQDNGIISKKEATSILARPDGSEVNPEKLRNLLENKGYDGIVYLNRAEGVSNAALNDSENVDTDDEDFLKAHPEAKGNDSYIAFRPEQIQPKYSAELIANTIGPSHAEVLKQWHAALSGNKSVEDANNLAWHSYADWLDAGKPTDRESIDNIIRKNGAQPADSEKKGNAAMSDTRTRGGKVKYEGLDTSKLYRLVNSPEMKGERPFGGDVYLDSPKNPLMGPTEGARKIPSMGATVAGKGNLNRLVIDAHIRDFFGHNNTGGPAAQYIADSIHLRQAAKALGLKGGEGQEQLWGTVLGLKQLLKQGLTPDEAAGTLSADVINSIGKDYAEVIANDPEITKPGGVLDRLKDKYGIGRGSSGFGEAYRQASSSRSGESEPAGSQAPVSQAELGKTAGRVLGSIDPSKIKKPDTETDQTSFLFGHNALSEPAPAVKKAKAKSGGTNALDLMNAFAALKKPASKK